MQNGVNVAAISGLLMESNHPSSSEVRFDERSLPNNELDRILYIDTMESDGGRFNGRFNGKPIGMLHPVHSAGLLNASSIGIAYRIE